MKQHANGISAAIVAVATLSFIAAASAAPLNGAGARVFLRGGPVVARVQYRPGHYRPHRMDAATRERITRNWFARARVRQEADGTILLPGIRTDHRGVTTVSSPPRSRDVTGRRIGTWSSGTGGRLTGTAPRLHR